MKNFYDFDPCTIDGSDEIEDEITLDNWKPTPKNNKLIQSKWRKEQIGNKFNQEPGLDDLNKINMYLKKKYPDSEIMHVFGITAETLVAIKNERYCPVDGISMDNLSKIHAEFNRLDRGFTKVRRGIEYLANTLFIDKKDLQDYKDYCDKKKKKNKKKKSNVANESIVVNDEEE